MSNDLVALLVVALIAGLLGYFVSVGLAALFLIVVLIIVLARGRLNVQ